jgi:hypothetical protein
MFCYIMKNKLENSLLIFVSSFIKRIETKSDRSKKLKKNKIKKIKLKKLF